MMAGPGPGRESGSESDSESIPRHPRARPILSRENIFCLREHPSPVRPGSPPASPCMMQGDGGNIVYNDAANML